MKSHPLFSASRATHYALLSGAAAFVGSAHALWTYDFGNAGVLVAAHFAFAAVCFYESLRLLSQSRINAVNPLVWILLASGAYYGIGPLAYIYERPAQIHYLNTFFPVKHEDLIFLLALHVVGVASLSLAFVFAGRLSLLNRAAEAITQVHSPHWAIVVLFTAVASGPFMLLRAFTIMDSADGAGISAIYAFLAGGWLTVIVLTAYAYGKSIIHKVVASAALVAMVVPSILSASKRHTLIAVVAFGVGRLLATGSMRRFAKLALVAVAAYALLYPVVLAMRYSGLGTRSAGEVFLGAVDDVYGRSESFSVSTATGSPLNRLCYSSVQCLAVELANRGIPCNSLQNPLITFIPRAFWPDKPTHQPGAMMFDWAKGRDGVSVGIGVFVESYWLAGYIGLVVIPACIGVMLAFSFCISVRTVQRQLWILWPLVVEVAMRSVRVDGWIQVDVITPFVLLSVYVLTMSACFRAVSITRADSARASHP